MLSEFGAIENEQHLKLRYLAKRFGEPFVKFGAYCPPTDFFEGKSADAIKKGHKANASALYVGSTFGLALQNEIQAELSLVSEAGFWIAPTLSPSSTWCVSSSRRW